MLLKKYFTSKANLTVISRRQASEFAKTVAGDFNPIHDEDNKRFCVPGDLLFALVLHKYGISQQMHFQFSGMVGSEVPLDFPDSDAHRIDIRDAQDKLYLSIERGGDISRDPALIENLTRNYVSFSGQTFPHILVPLMIKHGVMINPERPLVVYESMSIDMASLAVRNPELKLTDSRLQVDGKRGKVCLGFSLVEQGEIVGKGEKRMLLSGLRAYDEESINKLISHYNQRKHTYFQQDTAELA